MLVTTQMDVIANLQRTMETLNAQLDHNGSDTSITTSSYQKQIKTRQSPRKSRRNHRKHSSKSGSDQDMQKSPALAIEDDQAQKSPDASHASMDEAEGELDRGIHDDSISETMAHEYESTQSNIASPSRSISPVANANHDL